MRRRACVAEFSRKDGTVRLGRDLCASAEKSTIASVLQAASSIFCLAHGAERLSPVPRKVVAHLLAIPTASSALREL